MCAVHFCKGCNFSNNKSWWLFSIGADVHLGVHFLWCLPLMSADIRSRRNDEKMFAIRERLFTIFEQ